MMLTNYDSIQKRALQLFRSGKHTLDAAITQAAAESAERDRRTFTTVDEPPRGPSVRMAGVERGTTRRTP